MKHYGRQMTNVSQTYGYRHGDPKRDVDAHGKPVDGNYVVIVKIADTDITSDKASGAWSYDATRAPQAFKLAYGGTNYGYHEKPFTPRSDAWVRGVSGGQFCIEAGKTTRSIRKFLVDGGKVYSTSWHLPAKDIA